MAVPLECFRSPFSRRQGHSPNAMRGLMEKEKEKERGSAWQQRALLRLAFQC